MRKIDNVEKTIDVLCKWIQGELEADMGMEKDIVPEMVKALAELISARELKITRHA